MLQSPPAERRPRNWSEVIPDEVVVFRQSAWGDWPGLQLVHMAHRLAEFQTRSNFHSLFVYTGEPGSLDVRGLGRRTRIDLAPNQVSFAPAHAEFWSQPQGIAMENIGILIDPAWLESVWETSSRRPSELQPMLGRQNARIAEILKLLNDDLKSGCPYGRVFGETLTAVLAQTLLNLHVTETTAEPTGRLCPSRLDAVICHIRENLAGELRLRDMAALVGYSEFHFHRLFKQSTGLRVHEFIVAARLDQAEHLLRLTDQSVSMIAAEVGFADAGHLARHLRRRHGLSPSQYRVQARR
ncbi:MAG: AraC family transcriptional regulator [Fimbriimonadaceae bacterium]|nr:AraC family transcriptional regulator [Fimbriimonadaceae bacterium]